jgi:hypothetical protein
MPPLRLSIAKLSASGASLRSRFKSELLQPTWPREINYLRGLYSEIRTAADTRLFQGAEPKLRELIIGLDKVAKKVAHPEVFRTVMNAEQDFNVAGGFAKKADHEMADVYASYSLLKLSHVLDGLVFLANKHVKAYGYDVSGQVMEPGERENRSPNLWDQANSPKNNQTSVNPANSGVDEADEEFPELRHKHERVDWPARKR